MRRLALAALAAHALLLCAPALAQTTPPAPAPAQTAPAAAPALAPPPAPRDRIRGILHREPYSFCHDGRRFVRPTEMGYCEFVGPQSACPEFAAACERMKHRPSCSPPKLLGAGASAAQTLLLLGVITLATLLLVWLIRALVRARREASLTDVVAVEEAQATGVPLPAASAGELLARALEAHARGEHGAALYALYAALLRRLDERGVIRIDTASTGGDYVRQCGPAELKAPLRETTREVERVRFGGAQPSGDAFERLRARVEPIVRAAAVVLVAVLLAGATQGCGGGLGPGGGSAAGPSGRRAVQELLRVEGVPTERSFRAPENFGDVSKVMVLDGEEQPLEDEQWTAVLAWVDRGGAVVVTGGSAGWPNALHVTASHEAHGEENAVLGANLEPLPVRLQPDHAVIAAPETALVAVRYEKSGAPYGVWVTRGQGRVLFLVGDELVSNAGLAVSDNASAAVALLRAFANGRALAFVDHVGSGESNPVRSLAQSGLLPAVLQGLAALVLFFLLVGRHFGTPRDRTTESRRAFAEHVQAVGGLYARARASHTVLRSYTALLLERVRERGAVGRAATAEVVAARVGATAAEVDEVLRAAEREEPVEDEGKKKTRAKTAAAEAEDLRLAKRLNDWLKRLASSDSGVR